MRIQQKAVLYGHGSDIVQVAFSPDGTVLASFDERGAVQIWDATKHVILRTLKGKEISRWGGHLPQSGVSASDLAFSPSGGRLAIAAEMGAVQLCTQYGEPIELLATRATETRKVLFSPDGQFLAASFNNGLIGVWTPAGELVAQLRGQHRPITDMAFSPDAQILAAGDASGEVRL